MRITLWLCSFGFMAGMGWPAQAKERLAVAPLLCLGETVRNCEVLQQKIATRLQAAFEIELIPFSVVNRALGKTCGAKSRWWDCLEQEKKLFQAAEMLKARALFIGRLAKLGNTRRFLMRLADCSTQTLSSAVVEAHPKQDAPILSQTTLLAERIFKPPQIELTPSNAWYESWQFWTITSSVLALAVTGVVVGLTLSGPSGDWEHRLYLP